VGVETDQGPASLKRYNFLQEGGLATAGQLQIEQDFGYAHRIKGEHGLASYGGSTQLTYAFTDRFQLTLTAANYSYFDNGDEEAFRYDGSGFQLYYALTDPATESLGVSFFQSVLLGPEVLSLDSRVILVKTMGPWDATYNLRVGNDFTGLDGGGITTLGTLGHAFGLSRVQGMAVLHRDQRLPRSGGGGHVRQELVADRHGHVSGDRQPRPEILGGRGADLFVLIVGQPLVGEAFGSPIGVLGEPGSGG
jgi:hypothetical protein